MDFTYQVIRSDRRTVSIKIEGNTVVVRAPKYATDRQIREIVESKASWITGQLAKREQEKKLPRLTHADIQLLADQAMTDIPERVRRFAPIIGVTYGRITIRNQRSRWGSCSGQGNLNFNCLLMLTPPQVRDYVVIHELCHRKEMNHSADFWAQVARVMPDYKTHRQWLKTHGGGIIRSMTE